MTHIVTDGNYIIADKRASFMSGSGAIQAGVTPGTKRAQFRRDDSVKIILPKDEIYVNKKETRACNYSPTVAIAMAGGHGNIHNHPLNMLMKIGDMTEYVKLLNANTFTNTDFTILALSQNGDVHVISDAVRNNAVTWGITTTPAKSLANGTYISIGSGGFQKRLLEAPYKKKDITLMDAFFWGSYLDKSSSLDYSVYGREENHLFCTVKPSEEVVKASVDKVHALYAFKGLKCRYMPST